MSNRIELVYSATPLITLTRPEDLTGYSYQQFETAKYVPPKKSTVADAGAMLNGRKFNHIKFVYYEYEFVVSSWEYLDDFFNAFWTAQYKYLSLWTGSAWSDYKEVDTGSGSLPVSYQSDLECMPEIPLKLTSMETV